MPDQTDLRARIADAVTPFLMNFSDEEAAKANAGEVAAAVLAVLPPPADRATILREIANRMSRKAAALTEGLDDLAIFVGKARAAEAEILNREAAELRRMADEAQQGCARCGHLTCMGGKPCGVISTERGELAEPCVCVGTEAQQPEEPTAEQTARDHVLALHQIGEQLAGIESWMWERLADVRDAAKEEHRG